MLDSLDLIHSMLPPELIISCIEFASVPLNSLEAMNKQKEGRRRQRERTTRRCVCKGWRTLFPQSTDYILSSPDQLDKLVATLEQDRERGERVKELVIGRFEFTSMGSAPIVKLAALTRYTKNLEILIALPRLSSRDTDLLPTLSSLRKLRKIDVCMEDIEENILAR